MKRVIGCMLIIFFSIMAFGTKIVTFSESMKPTAMAIDDQQLYVVDGTTVLIYSLKDFKLKARFGRAGEGPGDFKTGDMPLVIIPQKDYLFIDSIGKISYFTKDGKFIKEMKTPMSALFERHFQPLGDKIIGVEKVTNEREGSVGAATILYDNQLKKIKELNVFKNMNPKQIEVPDCYSYPVAGKNKIAIADKDNGFSIKIYDANGNKVGIIDRQYEKTKVPEEYKERYFDTFKGEPDRFGFMTWLKKSTKLKDYYPAIQWICAADNNLYIQTYKEKNGNYEFLVYDFNGKFLKRTFLPVSYARGIFPCATAIKNGKFYQIIDNSDTEEWELHGTDIK